MLRTQSVNVTRDRLHAGGGGHHDLSSERSLSVNGTVVLLSHVQRPSPVVVRLGGPPGGSFKFTTTLGCRRQEPSLSKPAWARSEQARPLANATVDQGPRESESDFCFGGCGVRLLRSLRVTSPHVWHQPGFNTPLTWPWAAWAGPEVSLGGRRLARAGPLAGSPCPECHEPTQVAKLRVRVAAPPLVHIPRLAYGASECASPAD